MKRKIAIPADENGNLDGHFGQCRIFHIYETFDNQIITQVKLTPPPHEPGTLPKWLVKNKVTDVIAGGIGERAFKILTHFQINVHKGAPKLESGILVKSLLDKTLELSDKNCNHHHHEHEHQNKHEYQHEHHVHHNFKNRHVDDQLS